MNWELLTIILTNTSIFLWMRSEASADRREAREEAVTDRKESSLKIQGLAQAIHEEMLQFHKEQKDFHGRLCRLEEKYLQICSKSSTVKEKK